MTERSWALTEKEKQTLRLIVRGHDAKSTARSLGLSVHTINERLRDARRKMAVSSSREAARLLLEAEGGLTASSPQSLGDAEIGDDPKSSPMDKDAAPIGGAGRWHRRSSIIIGVVLMTFVLGLLALAALPLDTPAAPQSAPAADIAASPEVVDAARQFLALIDQGKWDDSYRAMNTSFRKLNTAKVWAAESEKMRARFGAAISRTLLSQEDVPAPPHGYEMVKFRTSFANKPEAMETVTLDRENGRWRVTGVTVE